MSDLNETATQVARAESLPQVRTLTDARNLAEIQRMSHTAQIAELQEANTRLRQELTTARALLPNIHHACDGVYDGASENPLMGTVGDVMMLAAKGMLR